MHDTIHMFASSPAFRDDGRCFAARDSGLYLSTDGGHSWHSAYRRLQLAEPLPTTAVLVSPEFATDQRVYAGVHGGIMCSVDCGQTWRPATVPEQVLPTCFAVSPAFAVDGTLFVGTLDHGVLRSGDQGSRWESWNFGLLDRSVFALAVSPDYVHDQTVFAGTESGLFRSTNGGRAWREIQLPCESETVLSLAVSPAYQRDGTLIAGTESAGLFASTSRGDMWAAVGDLSGAAINSIVVGAAVSADHPIMIQHGSALRFRLAGMSGWHEWQAEVARCQVTAVAAPVGIASGAPLLAGCVDGHVVVSSAP